MSLKIWNSPKTPCAIAAVLCCMGWNASAQGVGALPQGAPDAFQLDRQQRENLRQQSEREQILRPLPRVLPEPSKSDAFPSGDAKFVLRGVDFSPTALLDNTQLQAIAAPFVGQTISFNDLGQIIEQVNALYIQRNQVFARAVLPPQRVADGRVRVELIEAKLDALNFEGRQRVDEGWLKQVLQVSQGELLDSQALDERIQRFHRQSDTRLAITAQPGSQPSTSALQLQVNEPAAWSGSATLSSEGSDSTGRNQVQAELRWFSPLGRGDRVSTLLSRSLGATSANLAWSVPLSARWGTRLQASISSSRTHVINGPFAVFDIRGQSTQQSLTIGQPVWTQGPWATDLQWNWMRSKSENLFAGVGLGQTLLHQSNLTLTGSYRLDNHDASAYLGWQTASAKAATGLKTQDAKLQWGGSYLYRMPEKASLALLRVNGQTGRGATPLGSQSMSLGSPSILRAFSNGTLSDESGYALSAELHHALTPTLGLQVFAERGEVWGAGGRAGLRDWGVATEWRISPATSMNLTAARVMGAVPANQGRVRANIRLSLSF